MRILLTSDFYPPFIGGAERQVQLLGAELLRRGHEVAIGTVWQHGLAERDDDAGVPVRRLKGVTTLLPQRAKGPGRRFHPPFPDPGISLGLRRVVRSLRPHVVHANGWIAYSSAAALVGRRTPLLLSARDYGYSCPTRTLLENGRVISSGPAPRKCLACATRHYGPPKAMVAVAGVFGSRALLARKVRGIHSVSTFVEQIARRDLVREPSPGWDVRFERIGDIVPAAVHARPPLTTSDAELVARLPAEPFILFVGQLQPHKGLAVLLEAYTRLATRPPLVLIGTVWPDTPRSFPPGVSVLTDVPHRVVMAAWEQSLFGVVPSVWPDPLPGVVREAMSSGKPVVATAVGGNVDMVVDGETGLLVPPGDPAALADAMARLLSDAALRDRLAAAARGAVVGYEAASVAARFEALYGALAREAVR